MFAERVLERGVVYARVEAVCGVFSAGFVGLGAVVC